MPLKFWITQVCWKNPNYIRLEMQETFGNVRVFRCRKYVSCLIRDQCLGNNLSICLHANCFLFTKDSWQLFFLQSGKLFLARKWKFWILLAPRLVKYEYILIVRKQNYLISCTRSNRSRCVWQYLLYARISTYHKTSRELVGMHCLNRWIRRSFLKIQDDSLVKLCMQNQKNQ